MLDFEVQRCSRQCAASGRELKAGEMFYSALVPEGAQIVRYDYAHDAWQGPPANAIAWWKAQMPDTQSKKMVWAPSDVMLHYFTESAADPEREDLRYVLTLLMTRRRILRQETTDRDDQGHEWLVLFCPRNETEYRVKVVLPGESRMRQIQEELERLLFGNSAREPAGKDGTL
jgi:hypothetical protein